MTLHHFSAGQFTPDYYRAILNAVIPVSGRPSPCSLARLHRIPKGALPLAESEPLVLMLPAATDVERGALIEALCHLGHPPAAFLPHADGPIARKTLLKAAEAEGDADTVAAFLEKRRDAHAALVVLKRMGRLEYANALLLSEDRELVELVRRML